jgi:hypothetical protein
VKNNVEMSAAYHQRQWHGGNNNGIYGIISAAYQQHGGEIMAMWRKIVTAIAKWRRHNQRRIGVMKYRPANVS